MKKQNVTLSTSTVSNRVPLKLLLFCVVVAIIVMVVFFKAVSKKPSSFFVAGHVYGNPTIRQKSLTERPLGIYPAFMSKIINDIEVNNIGMGFFTGDIVFQSTEAEWDAVDKNIIDLGVPIHMAPGNHDYSRGTFAKRYATNRKTYYSFIVENNMYIILDPNISMWNIDGKQLDFLKATLEKSFQYDNVFVFFHQVLWWNGEDIKKSIANSKYRRARTVNFWPTIFPLFEQIPNQVYMFAGDTGVRKWHRPEHKTIKNVHLIASGMGGGVNDNYTLVTIPKNKSKAVKIEFIWLDNLQK